MSGKIIVYHQSYGCDTGCCGHVIERDDGDSEFTFDHPYGQDHIEFAKDWVKARYGAKHVADLDWENCSVRDDD